MKKMLNMCIDRACYLMLIFKAYHYCLLFICQIFFERSIRYDYFRGTNFVICIDLLSEYGASLNKCVRKGPLLAYVV